MAMMSMTGFGSATFTVGKAAWRLEIRSVNHKNLVIRPHWPSDFAACEGPATRLIRERLARGTVDVSVQVEDAGAEALDIAVDRDGLGALLGELRQVASDLGCEPPGLDALLRIGPFVQVRERRIDPTALEGPLVEALTRALDGLVAMRLAEAASLAIDLRRRLAHIEEGIEAIAAAAPEILRQYEERLLNRVQDADRRLGIALDKERVITELVVFADKSDLTEELVRARTHLAQFRAVIDDTEESERGRRLDFMTQEILRELNTIGSKCRDARIAQHVVDAKVELEKIREQVQNIA